MERVSLDWEDIDFTPEKVSKRYITFLLEYSECIKCHKDMVKKPKDHRYTFPRWYKFDFDAQVKLGNLVIQSNVMVDDYYICIDCAKKGKADFLCALCGKRKFTSKIKRSFGDPPEFLCTDCYVSVAASIWEEKCSELLDDHRYDFE